MAIMDRIKHAWNAFNDRLAPINYVEASTYGRRPDRLRYNYSNERSIIASVFAKLAIDVSSVDIRHVRLDENGRYLEDVNSGLNECLTVEANIDQGATHFRQDIAQSLFDLGSIAIVPVDTTINPSLSGGFDVKTLRVGRIVKLIRKLNLLDVVDEQSSSGKLDIIIQLPYVVKSEARRTQAEQRRKDIEFQLKDSKYGVAYTDGTEKITQLNRPVENNLLEQVKFLTDMLYSQLGITQSVMDGTADEKTMINYMNRTISPIITAIVEAMTRSFLTKTARSQKQAIEAFQDPFKFVPLSEIAEIADKFTRNTILAANEIRQIIGVKPSKDPKADQLRNANMPEPNPTPTAVPERKNFDETRARALFERKPDSVGVGYNPN